MKKSRSINLCTSIGSESLADVGIDQDLIIEILVRLPVKSLIKFKCVSKSWLSLISSPHFIRSHFSTSKLKADQLVNSLVLFGTLRPDIGLVIEQCALSAALYDHSPIVSLIEVPSQKSGERLVIIGIVNGLVCLYATDTFFIWNPILRKSKRTNFSLRGKGYTNFAPAFGYDESNDDYKVVFHVEYDNETLVMVYSLLMDSWRKIEGFKPGLPLRSYGTYANGKIYWSTASSSVLERKIVCIDMVDDKYGELQRPDYETSPSVWELGSSGEKLVVQYDFDDKKKTDLWVMDRQGVEESWTKVVSLPYYNVNPSRTRCSLLRVVCILRNGEIVVMSDGSNFLVYHSKDKEFRNIKICGGSLFFKAHVYVESLVSP